MVGGVAVVERRRPWWSPYQRTAGSAERIGTGRRKSRRGVSKGDPRPEAGDDSAMRNNRNLFRTNPGCEGMPTRTKHTDVRTSSNLCSHSDRRFPGGTSKGFNRRTGFPSKLAGCCRSRRYAPGNWSSTRACSRSTISRPYACMCARKALYELEPYRLAACPVGGGGGVCVVVCILLLG